MLIPQELQLSRKIMLCNMNVAYFSLFAVLLVEILLLNSFSIIEFCIFGQAFWNLFQKRKY